MTDLPTELDDESKFVPLNSEDPNYGPPVSSGQFYAIVIPIIVYLGPNTGVI